VTPRTWSARTLAILVLLAPGALSACGGAESDAPGGAGSSAIVNAGPLNGIVRQLEAEDDEKEQNERAESETEPEGAQEREETREQAEEASARSSEGEEQAIEEEAHVGASERAS
jgi:hypothetical protein